MPPTRGSTDYDESDLRVNGAEDHAAGSTAVAVSLKRSLERMGPARTARTLLRLNQAEGFDCMSCAWPDPDPGHRAVAEFCENGAKAVAEEATRDRATPEFFAGHSIADLDRHSEMWLGQQGRITHPMVKRPDGTHYEPIGWDEAFASNMCHESTSVALQESIGIGKASVTLDDVYQAELIVIAGQNPGTNHPRMLTALEHAKRNGARILTINPLREAGLLRFKNPQNVRGVVGHGTGLSDLHLPIRINGDLALFQAFGALLAEWDALDGEFVDEFTTGFAAWRERVGALDWDVVTEATGLSREQITGAARMLQRSGRTVYCWAMGLTQHRNGVATIKEVVNLALAQGGIGRPGAGLFPVRGHSNVQGDRTMGIWERAPQSFLDSLQREFGFDPRGQRAAAPAARLAHLHHRLGQGGVRRLPDRGRAGPAGARPAADPAQPRPVQHHHLRAQRPLPRHRGRSAGGVPAPETNPLVPLDSTALQSNQPASKSVVVSLVPADTAVEHDRGGQDATGSDNSHKTSPEPAHLS